MKKPLRLLPLFIVVPAFVLGCEAPAPKQFAPVAQPVTVQEENITLPELADFLNDNYVIVEIDSSVSEPEKIAIPAANYREVPLATVLDALLPPHGLTWRYDEARKCVEISAAGKS